MGTSTLVYSRALTKAALRSTVQALGITTRNDQQSVGLALAAPPSDTVTVSVSTSWPDVSVSPATLTFTPGERPRA